MNKLKVTEEWLNWFIDKRVQLVTTIDDREMFTTTIKGSFPNNQSSYETVFRLIEALISSYEFLEIEKIRLIWSKELEENDLQFYKNESNFLDWKQKVIKNNFEIDNSYFVDIEDSSDIFYNYSLNMEEKDMHLYNCTQNDRTGIYLGYNPKTNTTNYSFDIEFRKCLFMVDEGFEANLPQDCLEFNNNLMTASKLKMLEKLK